MDRIVIFGDHLARISTGLLEATIRVVQDRPDMEIVAVCDSGKTIPRPFPSVVVYDVLVHVLKCLFNPERRFFYQWPPLSNLYRVAGRFGIPVIVPENRDIHNPRFIQRLKSEINPSIGFSFWCPQIFRKELINVFEGLVNYHNSALPKYRGLLATGWSIYKGEQRSGYTFHLVSEGIDEGSVLYQGLVPLSGRSTAGVVELAKLEDASLNMKRVLEMLKNRERGVPQEGRPSYFGRKENNHIKAIEDPAELTCAELQRRLRAFGLLNIKIGGLQHQVTKIETVDALPNKRSCLHFITADGQALKVKRLSYLPVAFYPMYRALRKNSSIHFIQVADM